MKTILSVACCVLALGCGAPPDGSDPGADWDDATVDGKADGVQDIAINCYTGVNGESGASVRFLPETGEWIAEMKINDDNVRRVVSDFDGLEQARVRLVATNGMSLRVGLTYQDTVVENHLAKPHAIDRYRQAWKPAAPYSEIEHFKAYITVSSRPGTRYLCSLGIVGTDGE